MKFKLFCIAIILLFTCCCFSSVAATELNETQAEIGIDDFLIENDSLTTHSDDQPTNISNSQNVQSDSTITQNTPSNKKIYGIVDFGSNGIKLDVYQYNTKNNKIKLLTHDSDISPIKGYVENNNLTEKGINTVISIFEDFDEILELADVDEKYYYATASLRNINNADEIINTIKNKTGITIHILSGEQEANVSFNAVKEEFDVNKGLFMDLGGGSCELITFENKTPLIKDSLLLGSYSAYLKFVKSMYPDENEIKEIENWTLNKLKNSNITITSPINDLYINGGTISDIRKLLIYLNHIPEKSRTFSIGDLDYILEELNDNTKEDYNKAMSVIPDGINTIVPGTIIIKTIANYFNITTLHDCKNRISKGVLMSLIEDSKITITTNGLEKYYSGPEKLTVNVTNSKDNPIANQIVQFTINGMTYNRTTDENGSASLNINLNSGQYTARISVNYTRIDAKVNILPTVNGSDITKIYRNATQYMATFKDSKGNYLAEGTTVIFNINGVFYERKIGNKGMAILNINLKQGKYIITAINTVTGENTTNNITVLPKITENHNLTKKYKNESQFTVKILSDKGTYVGSGKNVTFNINGVLYTRQTNESGIAKLNINLMPGEYIITSEYEGCRVSNKITVLAN